MKKKAKIEASRCDGSPFCPVKRSCPQGAVKQDTGSGPMAMFRGGLARIEETLCTGCGVCVSLCPMGAVTMK